MNKIKNLFMLIVILMLLALNTFAYGNPLLEIVPENTLAVLEFADSEMIEYLSEMNLGSFSLGTGASDLKEYQDAREEAKNKLGYDVLDPKFIENIFSNGTLLACIDVSIGGVPEILIAVSPSDEHAFLKFIGAVVAKNDLIEEISEYKNIEIVKIFFPEDVDAEPFDSISYAFLGDVLVLGSNAVATKKAIDVYLSEKKSLTENIEYNEMKAKTMEKIEFSTFFACLFSQEIYRVLDELVEVVEEEELLVSLETSRDSLENMANIGVAGGYRDKSFITYTVAPETSEKFLDLYRELDTTQLHSLKMFPKNTFFYMAGIAPFTWEEMREDIIDENQQNTLDENLGQIRNKTGVDVEGILSAIPSQEFSIGIFDPAGLFPKVGLLSGFYSLENLEQHVYPIFENYAPMIGGQLLEGQYEGVPYKTLPNPMFPVAYGVVGDRLVVSTGINDMIDTYQENREALKKTDAINYMLSYPNVMTLLYIDMMPITQIAERFIQMSKQSPQSSGDSTGAGSNESTQAMLENLRNLKNVLFWAGLEENDVYAWLEVNYQ